MVEDWIQNVKFFVVPTDDYVGDIYSEISNCNISDHWSLNDVQTPSDTWLYVACFNLQISAGVQLPASPVTLKDFAAACWLPGKRSAGPTIQFSCY
jgi:hypothetical protein